MHTKLDVLEQKVWDALFEVKDPEIPTVSVVDLGIVSNVVVDQSGHVKISMTPTFTACPATEFMRAEMFTKISALPGVLSAEVLLDYTIPWTSDKITPKGRQDLKDFGYAPPSKHTTELQLADIAQVSCPYCDSPNTSLNNIFGPALCRSMHYCHSCKEAFQQFKPV